MFSRACLSAKARDLAQVSPSSETFSDVLNQNYVSIFFPLDLRSSLHFKCLPDAVEQISQSPKFSIRPSEYKELLRYGQYFKSTGRQLLMAVPRKHSSLLHYIYTSKVRRVLPQMCTFFFVFIMYLTAWYIYIFDSANSEDKFHVYSPLHKNFYFGRPGGSGG